MKRILHLSYEYSTSKNDYKTIAIGDLVLSTSEFTEPTVVSLDRVNSFKKNRYN